MHRRPTEIVEALWRRIWIDGELEALDELVADPYVRHTREGTLEQTPADYAAVVRSAIEVIRGTRVVVDDIAEVGDKVWARMTLHAVNLGVGDEIRITWIGEYRIADGKVTESWVLHESALDWSRD